MEREIVEKIESLNNFIKRLTDEHADPSNALEYEHEYIFNAYFYLTNTLKYDAESERAVKALKDPEQRHTLYTKLLSLKKCILNDIGVCNQFSSYLCLLIANNKCILAKRGNVAASKLNCDVKMASGNIDKHALNILTISGKDHFCDVTMGLTKPNSQMKFLLATEDQIQEAFRLYDHSRLCGTGDRIEIKPNSIESIYSTLDENRFVVNKDTPTYKTSKYTFR